MAAPRRVEDWFQMVPHLISEEGWEMLIDRAKCSLFHCESPWAGELLKIRVEVQVDNGPENPSQLLVRPEVRALYGCGRFVLDELHMLRHQAPGEALCEQLQSWGLTSFCSSFLEASDDPLSEEFSTRKSSWQRLSRDFPEEGDSSLSFDGDSVGLLLARPRALRGRYEINGVFHVTQEQFQLWDTIHLHLLFESASRAARWFVNRPGISELRSIDESFYTVLTVQSCRRGLPLLPCRDGEEDDEVVTIADGRELNLDRWRRFDAQRDGEHGDRFYLSQYVRVFLANLNIHPDFKTYNCLDGSQLVSFQCVVRRDEWSVVKDAFHKAFLMQKKAYRRANGGNSAPSLIDDAKPRLLRRELAAGTTWPRLPEETPTQHKVVVRRTFLDVDEPSSPEAGVTERTSRRSKTTSILQVRACGA